MSNRHNGYSFQLMAGRNSTMISAKAAAIASKRGNCKTTGRNDNAFNGTLISTNIANDSNSSIRLLSRTAISGMINITQEYVLP